MYTGKYVIVNKSSKVGIRTLKTFGRSKKITREFFNKLKL